MAYYKLLETRFARALAGEGKGQITTLANCRQREAAAGAGRPEPPERDAYLYCMSRYRTRRMERRFSTGDDSWVEIHDPEGFFRTLDDYMRSLGHAAGALRPVAYRNRRFQAGNDSTADAALVKDAWFESEYETRAIWSATGSPITPLSFELPELSRYCRLDEKVVSPAGPESERGLPCKLIFWRERSPG
jgi:hypothetical protein